MARTPVCVEAHIAARICKAREGRGMSRAALATALRVPLKQIERYESGVRPIFASELAQIARKLGVSVSYFFEGLPDNSTSDSAAEDGEIALWLSLGEFDRKKIANGIGRECNPQSAEEVAQIIEQYERELADAIRSAEKLGRDNRN